MGACPRRDSTADRGDNGGYRRQPSDGLPQVETPDRRRDRAARLFPLFGTTEIRKFAGAYPRAGSQLTIEVRRSRLYRWLNLAWRFGPAQRKTPGTGGGRNST